MGLLEVLIIVLLILWLMGAVAFPVGTSFIHLLLVVVLILVIVRLARGQRIL